MADCKNKLNKWDYAVAVSSGALTAALDVFFVGDISLSEAHKWGMEKVKPFIIGVANSQGFKGTGLEGAVSFLERQFPIPSDEKTNDFGSGKQHHLRDFSHHPTVTGLLFSVFVQLTGKVCGTDANGKFVVSEISGWKKPDLLTALYNGTVTWLFHMISDMAGSSSSIRMGKEGTGIPGPIMAFLKEMSASPLFRAITKDDEKGSNILSTFCSDLFSGKLLEAHDENGNLINGGELRFDLRTELGITNEAIRSKQHLPVIFNEVIVCSFYTVSRICEAVKDADITSQEDLKELDYQAFLPWNSAALRHMRTISVVTFSAIDISVAGTKAAVKNKGNPNGFAVDFLQGINYMGLTRLTIAAASELGGAVSKLYAQFAELAEVQKDKLYAAFPYADEAASVFKKATATAGAVLKAGTPVGFVSAAIGVYEEVSRAVKELEIAHQERLRIEEQCRVSVSILRENREEMEQAVSCYMYERLYGFGHALDVMDDAVRSNDAEQFVQGNALLQEQLGRKADFSTLDDFEELMASDTPLKM